MQVMSRLILTEVHALWPHFNTLWKLWIMENVFDIAVSQHMAYVVYLQISRKEINDKLMFFSAK